MLYYIGSKKNLSKYIYKYFCNHKVFVDVFGGSGSIIFNKDFVKVNVYNDKEWILYNFFDIVKNRFDDFCRLFLFSSYNSEDVYNRYLSIYKDYIETKDNSKYDNLLYALSFYMSIRFSFHGYYDRVVMFYLGMRRTYNELSDMIFYRDKLKNIVLENLDFEDVIDKYDSEETLFYCDPPYFGIDYLMLDFSEEDHIRFLNKVRNIKGKCVISGYASDLYDEYLIGGGNFMRVEVGVNPRKKREFLYMNYDYLSL